jgi:hypothetical protein
MADDEPSEPGSDAGPSLELPDLRSALGFRRRRADRSPRPEAEGPEPPVETVPPLDPIPVEPAPPVSPGPVGLPEAHPEVAEAVLPAASDDDARPRRRRPDLHLPGPLVALVAGALVGLALVGLTSASLHACSSMRGTSSCGKPGVLLLLVITVAMVVLGALLLRLAGVASSGSTSFLGVGLLVVVILIALLPVIFRWWMVIVVPTVAMVTYAASWWLTSTYVEPGERVR